MDLAIVILVVVLFGITLWIVNAVGLVIYLLVALLKPEELG